MEKTYQIAIDGPSGAGKSTIAKAVAKRMKIDYIDTGAMYRAIGYKMLKENVPMVEDQRLQKMLDSTDIDFQGGNTILDDKIVNDYIRTPEISMQASNCSAFATVRKKLVELQQKMAKSKSVIMDGRDIGTVVLVDAKYKYYLTATEEERATRRYNELLEKGEKVTYEQVLEDVKQRDHNDTTRDVTPLRKANDAVEIDSTKMSIEEVVEFICSRVK